MWFVDVIEAELLTTDEANDECLEGLGVMIFVFGWWTPYILWSTFNRFHAIPVDQEDPLVHLEIFNVERREQLNQFDGLDDQVSVFSIGTTSFTCSSFEDADQLVQKMRPEFSKGFSESLQAQSNQQHPGEEECEYSLFVVLLVSLFESFDHFLHQLVKHVVICGEVIILT